MYQASSDPILGATILIADDNPENLGVIGRILGGSGFRIRVALDGAQLMQSAYAERPDLFLLDVHMPIMDGYEACRRIKADPELESVPVVFMSGLSDSFNRRMAYDVGAIDYITKPFSFDDALMRVKNALRLGYYMHRCSALEAALADAGIECASATADPRS
jgi:CheY-like chemotaxis protein